MGKVSSLKGQETGGKQGRTKGFTSHVLAIFESVKCDHARIIKHEHKTTGQKAVIVKLTRIQRGIPGTL